MRHNTIITLISILLLAFMTYCVNAQTSVSGGIYTNTTWTLANSPYIVVDTVVIFPGVTLTIEPGVTVKFENDVFLEIRQAQIIATGTATDSITFTSNSTSPVSGIWREIRAVGGSLISQFNYCKIQYSTTGILNHYFNGFQNLTATLQISNSKFSNNGKGISCIGNGGGFTTVTNSTFTNNDISVDGAQFIVNACYINNNHIGIFISPFANTYSYIRNSFINSNHFGITGGSAVGAGFYSLSNSVISCNNVAGIVQGGYPLQVDTIYNCLIKNNAVGIIDSFGGGMLITKSIFEQNLIGLKLKDSNKTITCNKFCNNPVWDIYCKNSFSNNLNIAGNYWCASDSDSIAANIYDGYDNINLSLVNFMPVDISQCYSSGVNNPSDTSQCGLDTIVACSAGFTLYPDTSTLHNWFAIANVSGMPPFQYYWNWGDGDTSIGVYPSHVYDTAGYYNICLTILDSTGCISTYCDSSTYIYKTEATMVTVNVVEQLPIGIKDLTPSDRVINVFPNPATSTFKISLSLTSVETISVILYNQLGQVVNRQELKDANGNIITEIDVLQIPAGLYFLTVKGDGWLTTKKVLKD